MKIFKDVFSGDELFSDTYPMKLVDDCIYEVYGKHETRTEGDIQLDGANASAEGEDGDAGADPSSVSGIDIVLNHRLTESGFGSRMATLALIPAQSVVLTSSSTTVSPSLDSARRR